MTRVNTVSTLRRERSSRGFIPPLVLGLCFMFCGSGWADEIMPIGRILDQAKSLAAHLVTFKGRIEAFETFPAIPLEACFMATRYRALVKDDSGSIQAIVCGKHIDEHGELRIGDLVVIRAVLDVEESDGVNRVITATSVLMERLQVR